VQGAVIEERGHFEQSLALYAPQHRVYTFLYGVDSGVAQLQSFCAMALWVLGYPEQASQQSQTALTLAQELAHPMSLACARTFTAMLHQWARESALTNTGRRPPSPWPRSTVSPVAADKRLVTGLGVWRSRAGGRGLSRMARASTPGGPMGADLYRPYLLALLAEAHAMLGNTWTRASNGSMTRLPVVLHTGEGLYEAELYRLHGELLWTHAGTPQTLERAEGALRHALAIAASSRRNPGNCAPR